MLAKIKCYTVLVRLKKKIFVSPVSNRFFILESDGRGKTQNGIKCVWNGVLKIKSSKESLYSTAIFAKTTRNVWNG